MTKSHDLISSLEDVNAAIKKHNPFNKTGIVKEQNVWGKSFPDVSGLNSHASDAVFQAIEQVKVTDTGQDKVITLTVTAAPGVGKSHLISRIRHHLEAKNEAQSEASFIYASVNHYADLNLTKYQFQQTISDSFSNPGSSGFMQWQELATAIANEGLRANKPEPAYVPTSTLLETFDRTYDKHLSKNKNLIDILIKKVREFRPSADPYILRAVLWTLSRKFSNYAIKWLAGEELDLANSNSMGLPSNSNKTNQDREAEALKFIQKILNLASFYNPVVICFDEIDVENNCTDDGLTTPLVIADLVKRLYDTLTQSELNQGIVIITVMFPDTWSQKVNTMGAGTPDRLSTYTNRKPIELKYISPDSMIELVTLWLNEFYSEQKLDPPHSVYPFDENQLREYGKRKTTVREALRWCAENFKVDEEVLPEDDLERFNIALEKENIENLESLINDSDQVALILQFGFQTLIGENLTGTTAKGEVLNNVVIEEICEIKPKAKNKGFINFKIIGQEQGKVFKLGVSVLQHNNGRSVGSGLERLIEYEAFDLTRGCLVREKSKKIKKTWEAYKLIDSLIEDFGGEWAYLETEDFKPLAQIYRVVHNQSLYRLTEEKIIELSKTITRENSLLLEILSDPSGILDQEAIEEDQLLEDLLKLPDESELDNEDDLNDLLGEEP